MASKITRRGNWRPKVTMIHWVPLWAIWPVGHMLGGGHSPGDSPWLRHHRPLSLQVRLRLGLQRLAKLRLRLRLGLVERLGL